jgi:hypothetical protein
MHGHLETHLRALLARLSLRRPAKSHIPLLYRLRARARVAAICRADDDRHALDALAALPPLEGVLPGPQAQGIIFTSCDEVYFHRYGLNFVRSAIERSGEQAVHLHLFDPSPMSLGLMERTAAKAAAGPVTFSWERTDLARDAPGTPLGRYCVLVRFVRLWQALRASGSPILALDTDAVVRRSFTAAMADHRGDDVALFLRPTASREWRRALAAALLAAPTELGRRFMRDCAASMAALLGQETHTSVDQLVIYLVWRWYRRRMNGFHCGRLTQTYSDWAYRDDSLVWHAKGHRKHAPSAQERLMSVPMNQATVPSTPTTHSAANAPAPTS